MANIRFRIIWIDAIFPFCFQIGYEDIESEEVAYFIHDCILNLCYVTDSICCRMYT